MKCNPMVIPAGDGWQAWCPAHKPPWESPLRSEFWQARNDKLAHQGIELEPAPPWIRGPAR